MHTLVFATNNQHKVNEINAAAGSQIHIITLQEAGIEIDIPEPFDTLRENALQKATVIKNITGKNCFAEDTGLFVDALNGEPGVKSARYAGEPTNALANIQKLLAALGDNENRSARFVTIIALLLGDETHIFEGVCEGHISSEPAGTGGFGYDPVFVPLGSQRCFGQMALEEKELYSHRKKAVNQLLQFLQNISTPN
jgi:XTP/dITP diphosphohydrolase